MSEAPEAGASPEDAPPAGPDPATPVDPDSTVGTGSVFAIGCTLLMIIILLIGIALFISRQAN